MAVGGGWCGGGVCNINNNNNNMWYNNYKKKKKTKSQTKQNPFLAGFLGSAERSIVLDDGMPPLEILDPTAPSFLLNKNTFIIVVVRATMIDVLGGGHSRCGGPLFDLFC